MVRFPVGRALAINHSKSGRFEEKVKFHQNETGVKYRRVNKIGDSRPQRNTEVQQP